MLKPEETREVTNMARRLAAIVLRQLALDENYRSVKAATFAWRTQASVNEVAGGSIAKSEKFTASVPWCYVAPRPGRQNKRLLT